MRCRVQPVHKNILSIIDTALVRLMAELQDSTSELASFLSGPNSARLEDCDDHLQTLGVGGFGGREGMTLAAVSCKGAAAARQWQRYPGSRGVEEVRVFNSNAWSDAAQTGHAAVGGAGAGRRRRDCGHPASVQQY